MSVKEIDVERIYTNKQTAEKLHRIADAIEAGKSFRIQVNGYRVSVPKDAAFEIELETNGDKGEVEIEMRWDRRKNH